MTYTRPHRWTGFCKPILFCINLAMLGFATPLWGQFVYVVNEDSSDNTISGFAIDAATGALAQVPGSPFSPGGVVPAADPLGRFLYLTGEEFVSGYSISASTGALTPIPGSPFRTVTIPQAIAVDPTGKFVYVTDASSYYDQQGNLITRSGVSGFAINQVTGALTLIARLPTTTTCQFPAALAADPRGKFVYIECQLMGIVGYSIDSSTGSLTPIPGATFSFPEANASITVDPTGKYVYAVGASSFEELTINAATGALTRVPGSPYVFPAGLNGYNVAVDAKGEFVYLTSASPQSPGSVFGYTINAGTGALMLIPGSPFATGGNFSTAIAADPTGRFVYVTNTYSNNVVGFSINAASGALTIVPGSPAPGDQPWGIVIANPAPTPQLGVSVTPSSGSGASQVFAFHYSDSKGYLSLTNAYAGFGTTAYVEHSCRVEYYRAANKLYLKNDDGSAFLGPLTPAVAGTVANSQCTLDAGKSSVSHSGQTVILNLAFSFKSAFAGMQGIYMYAIDASGQTTPGRQNVGTWDVTP